MDTRRDTLKHYLHIFGVLLTLIGAIMFIPLIALPFYWDELPYAAHIALPAGVAVLLGLGLRRLRSGRERKVTSSQGAAIVTCLWMMTAFFCAMPFCLSGKFTFAQSYFQAVSFLTTTGFSVLDPESTPRIMLLFCSCMQFFGGVGFVIVFISALSEAHIFRLYSAEGHGEKLQPNLIRSTRLILSIYLGYFAAGTALYLLCGLPVFDSVAICMGALSTGGFPIVAGSLSAYSGLPVELVTIVLMILGATSFLANLLLIKGKFKPFAKIGEMRFGLFALAVSVPIAVLSVFGTMYSSLGEAFRMALFHAVSTLTTTGFTTAIIRQWPPLTMLILMVLMVIGGGASSTAGGIKLGRAYLLCKSFIWSIKRRFLPERNMNELSITTPQGKTFVTHELYAEAAGYFFVYIVSIMIGTGVLTGYGIAFSDALFEFTSAMGTSGLSVLNTPALPAGALWTLTAGMLLGRLEIYVVCITLVKLIKSARGLYGRR